MLDKLSGLAMIVQFDLFSRTCETLELRHEDIVPPKGRHCKVVSAIIAPLSERLAAWLPVKPTQNGDYDDTVIAGLKGMALEWCSEVLLGLKTGGKRGQKLFDPLDLPRYGQ